MLSSHHPRTEYNRGYTLESYDVRSIRTHYTENKFEQLLSFQWKNLSKLDNFLWGSLIRQSLYHVRICSCILRFECIASVICCSLVVTRSYCFLLLTKMKELYASFFCGSVKYWYSKFEQTISLSIVIQTYFENLIAARNILSDRCQTKNSTSSDR